MLSLFLMTQLHEGDFTEWNGKFKVYHLVSAKKETLHSRFLRQDKIFRIRSVYTKTYNSFDEMLSKQTSCNSFSSKRNLV